MRITTTAPKPMYMSQSSESGVLVQMCPGDHNPCPRVVGGRGRSGQCGCVGVAAPAAPSGGQIAGATQTAARKSYRPMAAKTYA